MSSSTPKRQPGVRLRRRMVALALCAGIGAAGLTAAATPAQADSGTATTSTTINPAAPTVTSISPASGPAAGGTPITITGTNLSGSVIYFGAVPPEEHSVSCTATTCTVLTPRGNPGTVQVTVHTAYGVTQDPSNTYTYTPSPIIAESERVSGFSTVSTDHLLSMTGPGPYLLVAFVSSDGPGASQSATVSGGGLTWTLAERADTVGGTAEIWTAYTTTSPENDTFTSTALWPGYAQMLLVDVFSGASGVGAVAAAGQHSGQIGATLTTTAANSWVYAVGEDYSQDTTIAPGDDQYVVHQYMDTVNHDTFWVQNQNQLTPTAGTQVTTYDAVPPLYDTWNFAAIEILSSGS